jgi:hypothetical protein
MIPGKIGKQGSPLKIENISITTVGSTNNIGSAVGLLSMGDVYAQITNGNISGSAGGGTHSNFGGVVGRMDGGQITNSSFQGTISLNQQFLYLGGIVGSVLLNGNGYHSIRGSYADVTFGSNSNVKGGIIGNMLISGGNPAFYIQDVYALIHGFGANNSGENGGLIGNYDNDGGGTVNLKNAVAIFNTAEVARGTIGELSTTNPGDLSGLNNSTIIAISAGMRVLTPKLGLGVGAAVGLYNTSWSDFEQVNMANFDFMESSMVNDANYPHPRFYWQYPAGTFPMDYDF